MAFWSNVQPCHEIHNIRWEEHLQQMNFTNFTQLEHYARANPLPQMEFLNINDEILQDRCLCSAQVHKQCAHETLCICPHYCQLNNYMF